MKLHVPRREQSLSVLQLHDVVTPDTSIKNSFKATNCDAIVGRILKKTAWSELITHFVYLPYLDCQGQSKQLAQFTQTIFAAKELTRDIVNKTWNMERM